MLVGDELRDAVRFWSLSFVFLGCLTGFSNYFQTAMFAVSGERLTERLRRLVGISQNSKEEERKKEEREEREEEERRKLKDLIRM